MNSITITLMRDKHLDGVVAIEREVFSDPWTRAMFFQDMSADYGLCYVAAYDEVVVGYVDAWIVCDECTINRIACSKKTQRSGIGSQLLCSVMHESSRRGAQTFFLDVRSSNAAAQQFYEKSGFIKTGLRKSYYADVREDAVLMSMAVVNHKQARRHDT
jgi:[ribosomal protein S18]-alanine N-acetyltransferase